MRAVTKDDLKNMEIITVEDYAKGMSGDKEVYLDTFNGPKLVTGLNDIHGYPSVHCGHDNGGFGFTYAVHTGTVLYARTQNG